MIIRRSDERGMTKLDWLEGRHSFSFGRYWDARFHNFGVLRVLNEDVIFPGKGFETHFHDNMEIVTFIIEGALQHKDSLGNGSIIRPGEIQRMTAGTGIQHSEFNASQEEACHLLQIWITPCETDLVPSYEQRSYLERRRPNKFILLASSKGEDDSVTIHQDARFYYLKLNKNAKKIDFSIKNQRAVWVHVFSGSLDINDTRFVAGDGLGLDEPGVLVFSRGEDAQLLLIEMAKFEED